MQDLHLLCQIKFAEGEIWSLQLLFFFFFFLFLREDMQEKKIRAASVKAPLKSSNSMYNMTALRLLSAVGLPCM